MRFLSRIFEKIILYNQQSTYSKFRKKYTISPSFRFNGNHILFYSNGDIVCGENSYIGEYSTIQAAQGCKVEIGKGCMISHNVRMYTSTAVADQNFAILPHMEKFGDIKIGNYVWIGANVLINPGITIGNNSVIGANSVVTKEVLENTIVGGVPAKLIRYKKSNAD